MALLDRFHFIVSSLALVAVLVFPSRSMGGDGEYTCRRCHSADELIGVQTQVGWEDSGIILAQTGCPGLRRIKTERLLTESRLLKLDWLAAEYRGPFEEVKRFRQQIGLISSRYENLLSRPLSSAEAFAAEAAVLRFELDERLNQPLQRHGRLVRLTAVSGAAGLIGLAAVGLAVFRFGRIRWKNKRKTVRLDRAVRAAVSRTIRPGDGAAARRRPFEK